MIIFIARNWILFNLGQRKKNKEKLDKDINIYILYKLVHCKGVGLSVGL